MKPWEEFQAQPKKPWEEFSSTAPKAEPVVSTPMAGDVPQDAAPLKPVPERRTALDFIRGVPGALLGLASSIPAQVAGRATALIDPAAGQKVSEALTYTPSERGQSTLDSIGRILEESKLEGIGPVSLPARGAAVPVALPQPLQKAGRSLMQSALKPSKPELVSGKGTRAVDTMLKEGINVTEGGIQKLNTEIDNLNNAIKEAIARSPATVDKSAVLAEATKVFDRFKNRLKKADRETDILAAIDEFLAHPMIQEASGGIPVQNAQSLKQGIYQGLGESAYGKLSSADVETQKALARGLKEGIAKEVPSVGPLNARESDLLNARKIAANRVLMDSNKNPVGLGWLNPAHIVPWLLDRSPAVKSLAARGLYQTGEALPAQATVPSPDALRAIQMAPLLQDSQ